MAKVWYRCTQNSSHDRCLNEGDLPKNCNGRVSAEISADQKCKGLLVASGEPC